MTDKNTCLITELTLTPPGKTAPAVRMGAILDTGCNVPLIIPMSVASELGLAQYGHVDIFGIGGTVEGAVTFVVDVTIGDHTEKEVEAVGTNRTHEILIGLPLLAKAGGTDEIQKSLGLVFKKFASSVVMLRERLVNQFKGLVERQDTSESELSRFLKQNSWVFGPEYTGVSAEDRLGLNARTDFLLKRHDAFHDIVEIKRATIPLFHSKFGHLVWSAEVAQSVNQMMDYLAQYSYLYLSQKEQTGMDVFMPKGLIVVGRSKAEEEKQLRVCNAYLHRIEVLTYDQLLERSRRMLEEFS